MAQTLAKPDDGAARPSQPSLRERLQAWWEGYDLPQTPVVSAASYDIEIPEELPPVPEWNKPRQELVQMLWGNGFSIPGEPSYVLDLVKPFGLTPENTMLEIGAGLGGGARAIASKLGTYVDGFDLNEDIAKRANEFSIIAGKDKKVKMKSFDPATYEPRKNYYDAALIRETLMAIDDKVGLIENILVALRPQSSIVIADYFLTDRKPGPAAIAALEAENRETWPCDAAPIIQKMEAMDFELRVDVDDTVSYTDRVRAAWAAVAAKIAKNPVPEEISDALMRETELWRLRNDAFEAGEFCMRRIVGFKQSALV